MLLYLCTIAIFSARILQHLLCSSARGATLLGTSATNQLHKRNM
jgi:hypothetical protein